MRQFTLVTATALVLSATALAVPVVSLHGSNVGISAFDFAVAGTTINISETWTSVGLGVLQVSGLESGVSYTVVKTITNNTGSNWLRLANELLDPAGNPNDADDVLPYPGFLPTGYTTSNNTDGLSFDQAGSIARISSAFASVLVDEVTDTRDFLDFFNGSAANGAVFTVQFGLVDGNDLNQPALLVQRPNADSRTPDVPEPGTMALLGGGLLACAAYFRRAQR